MNEIMRITYIKDLLVFQSSIIYEKVENFIEEANKLGVSIGDLCINQYVYSRTSNVWFLIDYIESLCCVICVFRNIYDDYIYELKLNGNIDNNYIDNFHMIFNAVNNTFNEYVNDGYVFHEFSIYHSEISMSVIMYMYNAFNDYFIFSMRNIVDAKILKSLIQRKNLKYLPHIYDKIFEQYEYIYLPFY